MNVSGSTASSAPWPAASSSSRMAFATQPSASRITGVAWIAATRTVRMLAMLTGVVVTREETPVFYVSAPDAVPEIRRAWERLEAVVPLHGRRFLGVVWPSGVYWAAVERLAGEEGGGLDAGVIPGGAYQRARLRGAPPGLYDRIAPEFEALQAASPRDPSRPGLEYYRRRDEVQLLLPVCS